MPGKQEKHRGLSGAGQAHQMLDAGQVDALGLRQSVFASLHQQGFGCALLVVQAVKPFAVAFKLPARRGIDRIEAVRGVHQVGPEDHSGCAADFLEVVHRRLRRRESKRLDDPAVAVPAVADLGATCGVVQWLGGSGTKRKNARHRLHGLLDVVRDKVRPCPRDAQIIVNDKSLRHWVCLVRCSSISKGGPVEVRLVGINHQPQHAVGAGVDARQAQVAQGHHDVWMERVQDAFKPGAQRRDSLQACFAKHFERKNAQVVDFVDALVWAKLLTHCALSLMLRGPVRR